MDSLELKNNDPELQLTKEDIQKVEELTGQIKLNNPNDIVSYGSSAQAKVSDFADKVLSEIKTKDSGYAGELLNQLLFKIKDLDMDSFAGEGSTLSKIPLIGSLFDASRKFLAKFEDLESQIGKIVDELHSARTNLTKDITLLQALYEKNLEYFKEIQIFIAAGDKKIQELRDKILPEMLEKAKAQGDTLASQQYQDMVQMVDRFEKKIHDLKLTRILSLQTGPQIRLIQSGNQVLVEKIQSSILNTIPLWKNQIVIALGLMRQRKALEAQKQVSKTTNDLIQKNAEMLKSGTVEIAKESEKGIIEIETLKNVNQQLIETITETLKIQEDGRQKRKLAEQEMIKIESDIKQKLLESK
ncbi:toxic anion resistance protein [Leptospira biflexa]|uniref:Putative TelA-like protein n=1 Tax=Leptospira biflexa serovar Patoc (strain Patoc 1 / ATCC 23582 / Paris) TaxID=456481 RepID=B0SQT6_LEPBP|nr:toxic anion resistance protein [Leptospira biflexa]ABZ95624.1 Tellurite resistance protein [Leptospira biflexa serovar Patoc strain 'Patoc 1 (Ames)']ABZ99333.1 Putative TelA-like protein [Leptospira biflexa serovar Patoc strain 'Patoc 1 (Paris)']TGM37302.1 toxic anion resistance protein [Leptospira biflexa]TGM40639.1 toxic anion resistance protein [Leptospira biflexa]TGM46842.1 toxic anion resistance protein [Leptospira biflexa]